MMTAERAFADWSGITPANGIFRLASGRTAEILTGVDRLHFNVSGRLPSADMVVMINDRKEPPEIIGAIMRRDAMRVGAGRETWSVELSRMLGPDAIGHDAHGCWICGAWPSGFLDGKRRRFCSAHKEMLESASVGDAP